MRKIICFILFFSLMGANSQAFLGEDLGSDLYLNIDSGFEELEIKQYKYSLSGPEGDLLKEVNTRLQSKGFSESCMKTGFGFEEIESVSSGNLSVINKYLSDDCFNGESLNTANLNNLVLAISEIRLEALESAEEKSKNIFEISRIGLYSDGDTNNSPFDLVQDLKDIDKIIFSEDIIYEGENIDINGAELDKFLGPIGSSIEDNGLTAVNGFTKLDDLDDSDRDNNVNSENNNSLSSNFYSEFVCKPDNSGLSQSEIDKIFSNFGVVNNSSSGSLDLRDSESDFSREEGIYSDFEGFNGEYLGDSYNGSYSKQFDNWGCQDIFCTEINFSTYDHQLLGGGQDISIEYLVKRSNNHLKKFVNTSLAPAKMTANNFELGLKDIDLSSMLSLSFNIQKKPIPILDIKTVGSEKEDETKFTSENLIQEYYNASGLDYNRANDINNFLKKDVNRKNIKDSGELSLSELSEKYSSLEKNLREKEKKYSRISESVDLKVLSEETRNIGTQFRELEGFSNSITEYIKGLRDMVFLLNEVPIDPS